MCTVVIVHTKQPHQIKIKMKELIEILKESINQCQAIIDVEDRVRAYVITNERGDAICKVGEGFNYSGNIKTAEKWNVSKIKSVRDALRNEGHEAKAVHLVEYAKAQLAKAQELIENLEAHAA